MRGSNPPENLGVFGCPSFLSLWLWLFALELGKKNILGWKISNIKGKVGQNPGETWQRDPAKVVPCADIFVLCFGEPPCSSVLARSGSACVRGDVNTPHVTFSGFSLFIYLFFVSGTVNISEADTAVVIHPVEMAVQSAHPTPRGSPEALILWLPVHSRHCTSVVASEHPDTAQLNHLMEMRSWDLAEALVTGNQKQRVTVSVLALG